MKPRGSEPARTVAQAAIVPDVRVTLNRWKRAAGHTGYILIGGLAYAFHARPRYTDDVDVLFLDDSSIPVSVAGFSRQPSGDFIDDETGVAVNVHTARSIGVPRGIVDKVTDTATIRDGVRYASLAGMVALKLSATDNRKRRLGCLAEILNMISESPFDPAAMDDWPLSQRKRQRLVALYRVSIKPS